MNTNKVAIVTPFYRETISDSEQISLKHLHHYLGPYDKFALCPDYFGNIPVGFTRLAFPARYFKSTKTYSKLLLSKKFYTALTNYTYILIYQKDALVFSDQLTYWCDTDFDYIGAPWIREYMEKKYDYPDAVGNGGFSLRKVPTILKVLDAAQKPLLAAANDVALAALDLKASSKKGYLKRIRRAWAQTAAHRSILNEDRYWAFEAKKILPEFKLPSVDDALRLAFETNPRKAYERNNNQLPFGCHAWERYDRSFWEPYLLR